MFKCTDCGQEYEIKPDFCDCGNNTFEEIVPVKKADSTPNVEPKVVSPEIENNTNNNSYICSKSKSTKSSYSKVDAFSIIIFLTCIVLSILSIIFIGRENPDDIKQAEKNTKQEKVTQNTNIPSIDKLWKESKVKPVSQPKKVEIVENIAPTPQPIQQPVQTYTPAPASKRTVAKQSVNTVKTTQYQPKPAQTKILQQTKKQTQQQPVQQPVTKQPVTTTQNQVRQTTNVVQPTANPQALQNYKIGLRNYLARSINFANIIGDGNCSVTFKVDTAGNLINRRFSVQSDNDSLNGAVHGAIMNNPTYQSPPTNYKGETLTFSVKMYGGRYNVTLY